MIIIMIIMIMIITIIFKILIMMRLILIGELSPMICDGKCGKILRIIILSTILHVSLL